MTKTMTRLFPAIPILFFFLLLSTSNARSPTTLRGDDVVDRAQKTDGVIGVLDSKSKILLPTKKPSESDPGSQVNVNVDGQKSPKESGKFPDELMEENYKKIANEKKMPASGSFAVKFVDGGEKRLQKGKEFPVTLTWRPINHHLDRMRVSRRSFPAYCRHRGSRFHGAGIRPRKLPFNEEKDVVNGDHHLRRRGKIISARWTDGATFHQLDAITFPDVDGEDMMIGEFKNPRFIFHRHHLRQRRRHDEEDEIEEHKERKGHALWKKIRKFLTHL